MSSPVEKIKERLSIVDVVSSYVKLEKAGASYKAKCPFHNEKTPSFFISPDRGTFYCFGCGAKGDIFTFVEQHEGVEFRQALAGLAAKAGVELVSGDRSDKDEKNRLYKTVEIAVEFFEAELPKNKPVIEYLHKRGFTDDTIFKWRIGFAKNEWRSLLDHCRTRNISESDLLATGLIKRNDADSGRGFYDVFRGRVMFPIFDPTGRPVAFSGRIFVDDEKSPKYLNSPATVLYNKSETLYGFDRAKSAIRRLDYSILVEGQIDLILSHQAGLANTVASSGTALTEAHLQRLSRLSQRVMFAFDADSAGFNATRKSAELALRLGMEVKVAPLPAGEDPASLIAKNPNLWKLALKNGKHIIDFYTDTLLSRKIDRRILSREIKSSVLPFILEIASKTEQSHFIKSVAEKSGLKEGALWEDLNTLSKTPQTVSSVHRQDEKKPADAPMSRRRGIERRILGVILWQESRGGQEAITEKIRKRLVDILGNSSAKAVEDAVMPDKEKLIFEAEQYYEQSTKFERDIEELFTNLEEETLKDDLGKAMVELHRAETDKEGGRVEVLLNKCQQITNKLADLRIKH